SAWVRGGLPSAPEFLQVAVQIAEALERMHRARLLHLDLNPEHVWVAPQTLEARLIGFSRARTLGSPDRSAAGLPRYLGPDQTRPMDRGVDFRSDLYALGTVFHFALTGVPPFDGEDGAAQGAAPGPLRPAPLARRADLPLALSRIVQKLLQEEPEDRYQTAG